MVQARLEGRTVPCAHVRYGMVSRRTDTARTSLDVCYGGLVAAVRTGSVIMQYMQACRSRSANSRAHAAHVATMREAT
jgi:hypothetical protein